MEIICPSLSLVGLVSLNGPTKEARRIQICFVRVVLFNIKFGAKLADVNSTIVLAASAGPIGARVAGASLVGMIETRFSILTRAQGCVLFVDEQNDDHYDDDDTLCVCVLFVWQIRPSFGAHFCSFRVTEHERPWRLCTWLGRPNLKFSNRISNFNFLLAQTNLNCKFVGGAQHTTWSSSRWPSKMLCRVVFCLPFHRRESSIYNPLWQFNGITGRGR